MKGNDEITGLFRSRLSGAEMTVRDAFQLLPKAIPHRHLWCRDDGAGWLLGGAERRPVKS